MNTFKRLLLPVVICLGLSTVQISAAIAVASEFRAYLHSIDLIAGSGDQRPKSISEEQKRRLFAYQGEIRELGKRKGDEEFYKKRRTDFDSGGVKKLLIEDWVKETGLPWPTYACSDCCRGKESCLSLSFEAHHVIPLGYNGPNAWWNIFPLTIEEHTGTMGIHSSAEAKALFPKVKK